MAPGDGLTGVDQNGGGGNNPYAAYGMAPVPVPGMQAMQPGSDPSLLTAGPAPSSKDSAWMVESVKQQVRDGS